MLHQRVPILKERCLLTFQWVQIKWKSHFMRAFTNWNRNQEYRQGWERKCRNTVSVLKTNSDYSRPDLQVGSKYFTLVHYQTRVITCPEMKSSMEKIKNHQTKLVLAKNKKLRLTSNYSFVTSWWLFNPSSGIICFFSTSSEPKQASVKHITGSSVTVQLKFL